MKVIKKDDLIDQNMTESAMAERNLLLEMSHPFILNLHYAFQTEHSLYLILDYVNGGDLFQHLSKKGYMSEKAVKYYGAQVVLALEYVHSQNIVYRDLKPENLLIDSEGNIKMADFGISK
jgi:serine/threonine protein kinase